SAQEPSSFVTQISTSAGGKKRAPIFSQMLNSRLLTSAGFSNSISTSIGELINPSQLWDQEFVTPFSPSKRLFAKSPLCLSSGGNFKKYFAGRMPAFINSALDSSLPFQPSANALALITILLSITTGS